MNTKAPPSPERPPDAVSGPPLSRRKIVAFSIILAVLVLTVLEFGAARVLAWTSGYDGEHLLQYEFDPYKNILPTRGYVDTRGIRHNQQGFRRDEDVARVKPAGTYRIFLMGGSTAYGTGGLWPHLQKEYAVLDNSQTIDAHLERVLAEMITDRRVEIINAAIPSIWTHHHLIYLNQTILGYDPDMVLFLDGFNDHFIVDEGHDQFASYAYKEHSHTIMGPPRLRALTASIGWWAFRRSALVHLVLRSGKQVKAMLRPRPERRPMDVESTLAALETTFAANALKMIERSAVITRHEGVRAVFMLQPMLILDRGRKTPEIERELFEFNVASTFPNYEQFMLKAVPRVARMERVAVEAAGGTFLDLTNVFNDSDSQIFTDYCHLTPEGNRILADVIAREIAPMIRETPLESTRVDPLDSTIAAETSARVQQSH
jgi:hypothetical protein